MTDPGPEIYETVFHSIENPALVIDLDFTVYDANRAAADFLRYDGRERLIGAPISDILLDQRILEAVAEKIVAGERWTGEAKLVTNDGQVLYGVGSASPIHVDGEPVLIAGVFTDLTEREQYVRSLRILNRVLRHNIRNDINVVLGSVEQIAAHVDEGVGDYVDEIRDRLGSIVNVADVANELEYLLNQQQRSIVSTISLDEILTDVLARVESRYEGAEFSGPDDVVDVPVTANGTATRVIEEVLENAVVHNDASTPRVELTQRVTEDAVVLSIADNGPGVDPSEEDLIFGREEYDQLHHGDGFSLFFVDQVMRIYGGDVWIEENEPRGTVVNLQFVRPV